MEDKTLQHQIDDINQKLSLLGFDNYAGIVNVGSVINYGVNNFSGLIFNQYAPSVKTTDATVTTVQTVNIPDSVIILIEAHVVGQRTGGSAGTAGDGAGYIRRGLYKRSAGGSPTLIGSIQDGFTAESQAGWDCTFDVSGNTVRVRVTGAINNNVTWNSTILTKQLTL